MPRTSLQAMQMNGSLGNAMMLRGPMEKEESAGMSIVAVPISMISSIGSLLSYSGGGSKDVVDVASSRPRRNFLDVQPQEMMMMENIPLDDESSSLMLKPSKSWMAHQASHGKSSVEQWSSVVAITNFMVFVLVVSLTVAFFEAYKEGEGFHHDKLSIVSENWILASGNCDTWVDGSCVPLPSSEGHPTKENLGGVMHEFEVLSTGLFSSVNSLLFTLSATVISTAFSFALVKSDSAGTSKMLNHTARFLLVAISILALFMQKEWNFPLNNLVLVEAFMLASILSITVWPKSFSTSAQQVSGSNSLCMLSNALTYPLIIISVLSTLGEDSSVVLYYVFVSTLLAWILMVIAYVEVSLQTEVNLRLSMVIVVCFWVCLIPFIVTCSNRIYVVTMEDAIQYPAWAMAALGLMLGSYLLDAIWFTFHYSYYYDKSPDVSFMSMIVRVLDLIVKYTLLLLVAIGYFVEVKK